jgi:hypothetical protein
LAANELVLVVEQIISELNRIFGKFPSIPGTWARVNYWKSRFFGAFDYAEGDEVYRLGQIVDRFHDYEPQTSNDNLRNHFWTLLLASIGLVDRYQWLQTAWALVCIGFLVAVAVYSTVGMYRNRRYSIRNVYYLPHWGMWVLLDDERYDKYLQRRRLTAPDKKAY